MNRVDFIALLQNPSQATPAQLHELEKVVIAFPYCHTAHLLIAKVAHDQKAMLADQRLKLAAAYAIDRTQLKDLINQDVTSVVETEIPSLQEFKQVPTQPVVNEVEETVSPIASVEPVIAQTIASEVKEEIKEEVKPVEPVTTPKDPELAEMFSHREKLMQELERKLDEIKKNREKFQHTFKEETPVTPPVVKESEVIISTFTEPATPVAPPTPIEAVQFTPEVPAPSTEPVTSPFVEPIVASIPTIEPVDSTPATPAIPVTPIASIHPIESILSSVEEKKNKPALPEGHEDLPDTVKAMYEASVEPIIENIGIHVLDEILRMDEKQQLQNEDLSIFKRSKAEKKNPEEVEAPIPTPLPPLPIEDPNRTGEHPVKHEHSLVPLNIYGKLEGHIASDNDTDNNSVNPEQADMLSDYLEFINNKRLRNKRDPRKVDAIIDRFIKDEPIISRLSPGQEEEQVDLAEKSYTPPAGMISENFARILLTQGKKDKAIKVYEELILKNPEKKDYFALLIEQIRKGE